MDGTSINMNKPTARLLSLIGYFRYKKVKKVFWKNHSEQLAEVRNIYKLWNRRKKYAFQKKKNGKKFHQK